MQTADLDQYLTADIIGQPYKRWNCYGLARYLYEECLGIDLPEQQGVTPEMTPDQQNMVWVASAASHFRSVWDRGDTRDPIEVSEPWDVWLLSITPSIAKRPIRHGNHIGTVINHSHLVHTSEATGVCRAPLKTFQSSLVQILRSEQLL